MAASESKQRFSHGEALINAAQRGGNEPLPSKQWVGGSNPSGRAIFYWGLRGVRAPDACGFANACQRQHVYVSPLPRKCRSRRSAASR